MGFVQVGLILGGNFLWWKFSGWELSNGNHPVGNFPAGSFHITSCIALPEVLIQSLYYYKEYTILINNRFISN